MIWRPTFFTVAGRRFCLSFRTCWMRTPSNTLWMLRTPLHRPLFSERYGYWKPMIRFLGFRFGIDKNT